MPAHVHVLGPGDVPMMRALLAAFAEAFRDPAYATKPPGDGYLRQRLGDDGFIALAALKDGQVVGGIAAYELRKFEQERSEIYLYDLAVIAGNRREGIATALIGKLKEIAAERGAYVIFVQADTGAEDAPAMALYAKMGTREEVLHFDIPVRDESDAD